MLGQEQSQRDVSMNACFQLSVANQGFPVTGSDRPNTNGWGFEKRPFGAKAEKNGSDRS